MVVQNQQELGEGSTIPTDPHHTPTIIQPSTTQPQKTQKPRKPKRKDTQVPQPSGPTNIVADEAVHKELGDSLVGAIARVESSGDEEVLGKDASKQGRTKVAAERFEINCLDEGVHLVLHNGSAATTINSTIPTQERMKSETGKNINMEAYKEKVQIMLDEEIALKLHAKIDEEERIARAEEEKIDEANIAWDDIQAKVDADYQICLKTAAEKQDQFNIEEK
ncbi:hypothetical protein Tco_0038249, partial [Tanacetum coccineum]